MGMSYALAGMVGKDSEYDILIDTLTGASTRFGKLEKAVIELRHLHESSESEDLHGEQVLEVLERHGA